MNTEYRWPVVPMSEGQLKDIDPKDILNGGLYRLCDISDPKNFDSFSEPAAQLFGVAPDPVQFVVQLRGCPLACPYCYVTDEGIHGVPTYVSTNDMIEAYLSSGMEVFHLMGGAPAYYIQHWPDLLNRVTVFHSDLLLIEQHYNIKELKKLKGGLYAVSIKTPDIYPDGTLRMLFTNLEKVITSGIDFYVTITGEDSEISEAVLSMVPKSVSDSVQRIKIRDYKALGKK